MESRILDLENQTQMATDYIDPTSIFKKSNRLITLKFDDVEYKVRPKEGTKWFKTKVESEEKTILKGISGIVRPGEMLAMLGPSGSGKTTLLTALGGRLGTGKLTGDITFNNKPFSNALKPTTGFVTQDDVLYPHLTVSETLIFTALLRLPNSLTVPEKIAHAEAVIAELNLTRCRNSVIGGPALRGISGGERKRVSIGQEMLINPSLLFLDEPTSGLDSTTALRIVSTLRDLAKGGRTVVMTIHQPSSRLFYMFHKLLLLSEGNSLYFGTGSAAMEYFARIGYSPSMPMNPSDFLLDIANGITPNEGQEPVVVKQILVMAYKANIKQKLKEEIVELDHYQQPLDMSIEEICNVGKWPTTWWQQFTILFKRGVKVRRHDSFSGLKICQVLWVALFCGCLWWQSGLSRLQDQIGLLFFMASFWGFFPLLQAIFTFPKERQMLQKERSSRMYRLSSYFISRMVADLPMELILPTIFLSITYPMAGLKPAFLNFISTLLVLLFCVLVSQGLGLAIGAVVMDLQSATVLGSVVMLCFLLAGGFYVQHVPSFISWIRYISIGRYAYKLLILAQYKAGEMYRCGEDGKVCYVEDFEGIKKVGLDGKVGCVVALAVMLVGYRVMAYIALMRIGKTKK